MKVHLLQNSVKNISGEFGNIFRISPSLSLSLSLTFSLSLSLLLFLSTLHCWKRNALPPTLITFSFSILNYSLTKWKKNNEREGEKRKKKERNNKRGTTTAQGMDYNGRKWNENMYFFYHHRRSKERYREICDIE